ncbi:MAG: lysozyme inhibitor LprI family protein [Bryobacteraceae bacterium]
MTVGRIMPLLLFLKVLHPLSGQDPGSYQKKAEAALRFEVARIGKDCPAARTTIEENNCIVGVEQQTRENFQVFYDSLRLLLGPKSEAAIQLDNSQSQWEKYSKEACDAVDSLYRRGSIRLSAVETCKVPLMRSRMQDLNALYITTLHL